MGDTSSDATAALNRMNEALAIGRARGGFKRKASAREDVAGFKKLKTISRQRPEWRHRFVCLAKRRQYIVPTKDSEKDALLLAGLGEKSIDFPKLSIGAGQFKDILLSSYPKLCDAGGFELCVCKPNSLELQPLTSFVLSSPAVLKERCGCKRTYIVPLQRDLNLSSTTIPHGVRGYLHIAVDFNTILFHSR